MSELVRTLVAATGLGETLIWRIIASAPRRYKVYTIPKRDGGRREIAHPSRELKALQRALSESYLANLPVHPAATAYEGGASIKVNALRHASNSVVMKMDLKQFFPSIKLEDWICFCDEHSLFIDPIERRAAGKILFFKPKGSSVLRLAIGAPSSPHLSNLMMYNFDVEMQSHCDANKVTYTRYADDLTFSATRTGYLTGVERAVRVALRSLRYPRLYVNDEKTVVATKKYRRQVTGLVLTNDGKVSIGRDRKRHIRVDVHRFSNGLLDSSQCERLCGQLGFASSVDPAFLKQLEKKFGDDLLARIGRAGLAHRTSV